jgi:putative transposase
LLAAYAMTEHGVSKRRACRCVGLSRSVWDYKQQGCNDEEVMFALASLVERYPRYGFRKLFKLLRKAGHQWNHKKVYRVYSLMKLNQRRKHKKRYRVEAPQSLLQPLRPIQAWSMDFMSDVLRSGRAFRTLNILDDYHREILRIEVDVSLTAERVVRVLEQLIEVRGAPERIRVDHGPEFTSVAVSTWCAARDIKLEHIQPGKPNQNGFIERFNGTYRDQVLDAYLFDSIDEVREVTGRWVTEYNTIRPHESLGDISPIEFLTRRGYADFSTYAWP